MCHRQNLARLPILEDGHPPIPMSWDGWPITIPCNLTTLPKSTFRSEHLVHFKSRGVFLVIFPIKKSIRPLRHMVAHDVLQIPTEAPEEKLKVGWGWPGTIVTGIGQWYPQGEMVHFGHVFTTFQWYLGDPGALGAPKNCWDATSNTTPATFQNFGVQPVDSKRKLSMPVELEKSDRCCSRSG